MPLAHVVRRTFPTASILLLCFYSSIVWIRLRSADQPQAPDCDCPKNVEKDSQAAGDFQNWLAASSSLDRNPDAKNYLATAFEKGDITPGDDTPSRKEKARKIYDVEMKTWMTYVAENENFTLNFEPNVTFPLFDSLTNSSYCPEKPPNLAIRARHVTDMEKAHESLSDVSQDVLTGGRWQPTNCRSLTNLAVIVPYRDRPGQLQDFLGYMIPIFKSQNLNFTIVLVEQLGDETFNKGRLMNAGFEFVTSALPDTQCVVFHDVDLLPQSAGLAYNCRRSPAHLGAFFDKKKFKLIYSYLMGGVVAIRPVQFEALNGFSNFYWGWGGEDDDFGLRIERSLNLRYYRPENNSVPFRYLSLRHSQRSYKSKSFAKHVRVLVDSAQYRFRHDGYAQHVWRIANATLLPLYTHVFVDVGPIPKEWR